MIRTIRTLLSSVALVFTACTSSAVDPLPPKPLVLVAIGASDAVGIGATDPAKTGWVPVLYSKLPEGSRLVNLGISGAVVADAVQQQLPVALDANPDLVIIWIAVNDIRARTPLEAYEASLDQLVAELDTRTSAQIVLANVPNLSAIPAFRQVPAPTLATEATRWNEAISRVATRHNVTLVDLMSSWRELAEHPEYISNDGFHPSDAGYRRLADLFWDAIQANQLVPAVRR